jgi:hypothetical protein
MAVSVGESSIKNYQRLAAVFLFLIFERGRRLPRRHTSGLLGVMLWFTDKSKCSSYRHFPTITSWHWEYLGKGEYGQRRALVFTSQGAHEGHTTSGGSWVVAFHW